MTPGTSQAAAVVSTTGYPLLLDLRDRLVVVVGLGAVGRRKAEGLRAAGATVRGIDPLGASWLAETPTAPLVGWEIRAAGYRPADLDGACLAVAAARPEVNALVVRDARARGVWVASSSDPEAGDWTAPAVWRDGPLTLAVATGGASPALASALRDRLAVALGPEPGRLARLLLLIRAAVRRGVADPTARRVALARAGDPAWLDFLADHGEAATAQAIGQAIGLPEAGGIEPIPGQLGASLNGEPPDRRGAPRPAAEMPLPPGADLF